MGRHFAFLALCLAFLALARPAPAGAEPNGPGRPPEVVLQFLKAPSGPVYFARLSPELLRTALEVQLAAGGRGDAERFDSFVRRIQPAMAVNGTYFAYSEDRGFTLVLPVYGDGVHEPGETERASLHGSVLAVRGSGQVVLHRLRSLAEARSMYRSGDFRVVIGAGPTLVHENRPLTSLADWEQEGFSTTGGVLDSGDRPRVGAGISPAGELILASSAESIPLDRWARILHEIGCVEAVNLDGGKSQGLFTKANGFVQMPTDPLTNVIVIADPAAEARPAPDARGQLQAAKASEAAGQLEEAVEHYRDLVYHHPDSIPGYLGAARALEKQGNRTSAAAFYAQAGLLQAARGDAAASRESLHRALALSPGRVDVATRLSGLEGTTAQQQELIAECLGRAMATTLRRTGWGRLEAPFDRAAPAVAWQLPQGRVALPPGFRAAGRSQDGALLAVDLRRGAVMTVVPLEGAGQARRLDLSGLEFTALRREIAPGLGAVLLLPSRREAEGRQILERLGQ